MCRCSFWAIDTMWPERSKIRQRDDAVPWSIAATYRSVNCCLDSPGDRPELTGHGSGTLTDLGNEVGARRPGAHQPLRWPEDAHRADVEPGAVGDRGGDRHLSGAQLTDLG